ncbi:MAG: hypothetical protein HYY34_02380 [Chloroflexi bacterium]|nr:hypothetical protein [Chloroflexota bacterium]
MNFFEPDESNTGVTPIQIGLRTGMLASGMGKIVRSIAPGAPPPPDKISQIEGIKKQIRIAGRANAVLVIVAVGSMAIARYV